MTPYSMNRHPFSPDIKNSIQTLCRYDNRSGFAATLLNHFCIALAVAAAEHSVWLLPLSLLIIGSRQRALATLLHEAAHGTLCRNKILNRVLGTWFSGYLIGQSWGAYRRSHVLSHHARLGDLDRDPDYRFYVEAGVYDAKERRRFLWQHVVRPMLFLNAFSSAVYLIRERLLGAATQREFLAMVGALLVFACVGTWWCGPKFFFLYWLLPYLTTFQMLTWFIELSEHYPMVRHARTDIEATRNRFSHPVEQLFTGMHAENFHLVHHLFPGLPFRHMAQAHRILLKDETYARLNAASGGIFLSSNFAPSLISRIMPPSNACKARPAT